MKSDFEASGRLHPKIDIFMRDHCGTWQYQCSSNWWRLCRDAAQHWADIHLSGNTKDSRGRCQVKARFAR